MTALLVLIYIAFISLGLPDPLLGAAWPSMYRDLGVNVALAGPISIVIGAGTVLSSLMSARWIAKFGTGKVTAVSVLATAVALLGFSLSDSFWMMILFAIPLGIGAGAVDSGLNNFVALHYQAKHMNWLHSFWGIGATLGPAMMGAFLTATGSWRSGYFWLSVAQAVLVVVLFTALPLWKKAGQSEQSQGKKPRLLSVREILKKPLAKPVFFSLLCYCGAETTVGLWGASYLAGARGVAPDTAATWGAAFFAGITAGRFLAGFLAGRWNNPQMIRLGASCALIGVVALFPAWPAWTVPLAFFVIGLGFAPIFPAVLHQTPRTFGEEASQSMIGVEMAFAYMGNFCIPPLFGAISGEVGIAWFPAYLMFFVLVMTACTEYVKKRAGKLGKS